MVNLGEGEEMSEHDATIERLAEAVVLLDATDWQSLLTAQQYCQQLLEAFSDDDPRRAVLAHMDSQLDDLIHERASDNEAVYTALVNGVAQLQGAAELDLQTLSTAQEEDAGAILEEFAQRALGLLDALEEQAQMLEQDESDEAARSFWRRHVHTIKGESGMLELADVQQWCSGLEDALAAPRLPSQALFPALTWLRWRLGGRDSSDESTIPDLGVVLAALVDDQALSPATAGFRLAADAALLGEFTTEASEHLENAEVHLLELDTDASNVEAINALFRSFHTIKGLAGFMELDPIQKLAHHAETFLDICRQRPPSSAAIDLVFDAIDGMKRLNLGLREAIEKGKSELLIDIPLDTLCGRLLRAVDDERMFGNGEEAAQPDPQGPRLGEILVESGLVEEEELTQALQRQAGADGTKRRLGEVLVRQQVVDAKQVSKALRRQRQSGATVVRDAVKVDALRLDRLVDAIGELVIAESMVSQDSDVRRLAQAGSELGQRLNLLGKITRELQEIATSLRMTPIKSTFQRMARLARDVATRTGKAVDFRMYGEDTELDKNVVDRIGDPLVHMVRNAIDHGLEENSAQRQTAGKSSTGLVELRAFHQGGNICIQIRDDGRGMDRTRLTSKAVEKGIISAAEAQEMSDSDVYKLIFHPGFSTAAAVSDLSGRGVGMDVVKKAIQELRGQVDIDSSLGKGSTFTIRLPLTLAIIDGMVCRIGGERYIIPTLAITRSMRPMPEQLSKALGKGELINLHGEVIPIIRLHRLLNVTDAIEDPKQALLVVLDDTQRKVALMVDELLGKQQIVIKSLGSGLRQVPGIAGGAIMSDGSVGLIADPPALVALAHG
ncbi:MAG: chemotaxis protein CheA [Planctomycetota bacterium]|nr:MAG: chemotaxis protein CheA [Planctomycetota bacterium]